VSSWCFAVHRCFSGHHLDSRCLARLVNQPYPGRYFTDSPQSRSYCESGASVDFHQSNGSDAVCARTPLPVTATSFSLASQSVSSTTGRRLAQRMSAGCFRLANPSGTPQSSSTTICFGHFSERPESLHQSDFLPIYLS